MTFDISALKEFDVVGPRYTSYPTAPVFSEQYGAEEYIRDLRSRDTKRNLSLYFHLPYCDTLCYFCGCNMKVSNDRGVISSYLDLIEKEILQLKSSIDPSSVVSQCHWGGGTPTHLTPDEIRRLGQFIRQHFTFSPDAEWGVEIDPRGIGEETVVALREVGFNRASMGLQDFDLKVQKAVNRVHDFDLVNQLVQWIRQHGFESLNLDLIYGLPYQSVESFDATVKLCLQMSPDRLALFNFAYLPNMIKHQSVIDAETLPTPEEKLRIFESSGSQLIDSGYVFVGMDHFAKEEDSLVQAQREGSLHRNFQGYSTHAGLDLVAFGASGISQLQNAYSQNIKTIKDWRQKVADNQIPIQRGHRLSQEDQERRDLIFTLMCAFELDFQAFSRKWNVDFLEKYAQPLRQLKPFIDKGCLQCSDEKLMVTAKGRLVIRNIVMPFDAYLTQLSKQGLTFSRTV